MARVRTLVGALVCMGVIAPAGAGGQELADLDYEYLAFRGFGFDVGYLYPSRVDRTFSFGARFDMGYAGPGLRIVPHVSYWSSPLEAGEISEFEERIAQLVADQNPGTSPTLNLGPIDWRDVAIGVDAHVVWDSLFDILTYGGLGVAAHVLDGQGDAIAGTFVDDLLDTVTAGFNLHFGAEYPVTPRMRIYSLAKYEVLTDLQYFNLRLGWQLMTGPNAPGEER